MLVSLLISGAKGGSINPVNIFLFDIYESYLFVYVGRTMIWCYIVEFPVLVNCHIPWICCSRMQFLLRFFFCVLLLHCCFYVAYNFRSPILRLGSSKLMIQIGSYVQIKFEVDDLDGLSCLGQVNIRHFLNQGMPSIIIQGISWCSSYAKGRRMYMEALLNRFTILLIQFIVSNQIYIAVLCRKVSG